MVAHEIAHWRRADHMWRIAYQLTQRLFFFQVFNRYAVAKLDLLAEFDCDNAALRHQSAYSYSETLLECAQRGITGQPSIRVGNGAAFFSIAESSLTFPGRKYAHTNFFRKIPCSRLAWRSSLACLQ